jgi:uncharacterized protein (TIGR04255 family)
MWKTEGEVTMMLFSDRDARFYANSPLHEVICQLRFPTILSIGARPPVDYQEAIRTRFPLYAVRQDQPAPKITGVGTDHPSLQKLPPVTNYNFVSEDGRWKINLTQDFIALSTLHYTNWSEFARMLDEPLGQFIRLYQPAFFERIGLRYLNMISREKLGLKQTGWAELLHPAYLGPMAESDLSEDRVFKSALDTDFQLDSSCRAHIHAGPGSVKNNATGQSDPETKFILDLDLFLAGKVKSALAPAALETLHGHAIRLFEGAVTDTLREKMV